MGITNQVVAPSLIPRKAGDRIKTDRRDSQTLARLLRAGELTPVWVPDEPQEALRDLTRGREDLKHLERQAKQRLQAFLLRHGRTYGGEDEVDPDALPLVGEHQVRPAGSTGCVPGLPGHPSDAHPAGGGPWKDNWKSPEQPPDSDR